MNVHEVFSSWSNFYVITGSSSAALTGLVFVVITLVGERRRATTATTEGTSIFTSPTIVHFCSAFLISCVFAAPWPSPGLAGTSVGLTGLAGLLLIVQVAYRAWRIATYRADLSDWFWFVVLPAIAYSVLLVAGFMLVHVPVPSSFAIGAGVLVLIFVGIHNAWDVVTYLAITPPEE